MVSCLVQFIVAQGLLLGNVIEELRATGHTTTHVVEEIHHETRQVASQSSNPVLPNPVPPS